MPTLLMDTTRDTLMLALTDASGQVISVSQEGQDAHRYHSSILLPQIQALLQQAGLTPHQLTGVGVNCGPGSFTGIRTGLSVARLMGQFLPVTTYGFNTFLLLAAHAPFLGQPVTVYLNAFRQQHYHASLQVTDTGDITWFHQPGVYANAQPVAPQPGVCLVEASLEGKLPLPTAEITHVEDCAFFTPQAMAFYLARHAADYTVPWAELQPIYLQLPHITQPKSACTP